MRLIDADALDDVIQILNEKNWGITRGDYKMIDAVLFEFPTVEERKTGKWMHDKDDELFSGYCSCCGWESVICETDVADMPYCPNCGAYMRGEADGQN